MPQDQNAQPGPQGETNPTVPPTPPISPPVPEKPAGGFDLGKILLPKKPLEAGKTPDTGVRVNAGVLLEREQNATLPMQPKPAPLIPPVSPKDDTVVKAVETYQGDIEKLVQKKNVSVVSMAAAEEKRRANTTQGEPEVPRPWLSTLSKTAMIIGGIGLLAGAGLAIFFVTKPAPSVIIETDAPAPFIYVDETFGFNVPLGSFKRAAAMAALEGQRQQIQLSLGLIARIYLAIPPTTPGGSNTPLSVAQLLAVLAPNVPAALLRAVDPYEYLLGVHSYDGNQAFLILKTTSYEQTFSGMLQWEQFMRQDLAPLFSRRAQVQIQQDVNASSTTPTPDIIQTGFIDRIIENHDVRAVQDINGEISILWSFVDRNTLVITTNEATLREITSRLKGAPIVPLP